jgi:hypothetical protein
METDHVAFPLGESKISARTVKFLATRVLALTSILVSCSNQHILANPPIEPTSSNEAFSTATDVQSFDFPEDLRTTLEVWASKQEDYKEIAISPPSAEGYIVMIHKEDGSGEHMFRLARDGKTAFFMVDGEEVAVDINLAGTRDTGGYNKFYFGVEPEEGHYMWRYPWGGWVRNENQTFAENGVAIIANEAELYGGLFTINKEYVEEYWEKFVTGIYYIQVITRNTEIVHKYSLEGFLQQAKNTSIENVRLWVAYPEPQHRSNWWGGTWKNYGLLDLSEIALSIPQMSDEIINGLKPTSREYLLFNGIYESAKAEAVYFGQNQGLRFSLRKADDLPEHNLIMMRPNESVEHNWKAATQLINSWIFELIQSYSNWLVDGPHIYNPLGQDVIGAENPTPHYNSSGTVPTVDDLLDFQQLKNSLLLPK